MRPIYDDFYEELKKVIKKLLPPQLHQYRNYYIYMSFLISHVFTIGCAYYDGKIYKPKDDTELSRMTLSITVSDRQKINENKNFVLLYRSSDV